MVYILHPGPPATVIFTLCVFFFVEQKYLGLQKKENTLLINLRGVQTKTEPRLWKQMKKQTLMNPGEYRQHIV